MTILLKNAKIYDGTAAPPFQGDLLFGIYHTQGDALG